MNWGSVENFLAMGGYGFYVWGAYAISLLTLLAEIAALIRRRRTLNRRMGLIREVESMGQHETSA
ncbi:heme exporter protein CcmD [Pelomicrobium methylotrophicum]|uniref:Heme exporter protein D n=1 Tax=Pelomicrobium methylotrophicum TaxID=2602750 RepID=A0A5C7EFX7_9PROT|nr:heme exporter protein CcmD [Pelomicrobium methylotrophicum]TXF11132.1 heme exporter protein CcmD [Pelomicrobium methylotrophicum]